MAGLPDLSSRPNSSLCLTAVLLGCTALVVVTPGLAAAQSSDFSRASDLSRASDVPVALDTLTIQGTVDDSTTIVADQSTAASGLAKDILETPASVSVITAKEIQQRNANTVEQVLQYSPAVVANFYGADDRFDSFKMRGFDAYTYRDGLPLGRSFGGVREEVFAFERVEVIRGGNSTAFGVSDPGGSVNYVTKTPKRDRFGEIYGTVGSYNAKEVGFDFGDNLTADGTLSYRLTGKLRDTDAEYDYSRDDEKFLMASLTWRPSDATELTFVFDHLKKDGVLGSGGHPIGSSYDRNRFFGEPSFNYRGTDHSTATVMFDHDFGGGFSVGSTLRYSDTETDFGYAYITNTPAGGTVSNRGFFATDNAGTDLHAKAHLQYDGSFGTIDSRTLVGLEFADSDSTQRMWFPAAPDIDTENPVYSGGLDLNGLAPNRSSRSEQTTKAIFLQQELTFSDQVIADIGLRHDWIDVTQTNRLAGTAASAEYSETTARAGLTYKITPDMSVYGSYSQSVVPAALSVEPERGEQYELGMKYRPAGGHGLFSAAIYDLSKSNITRTNPVTNLQETIGEVQVRGIDLEAKYEMSPTLSFTGAYSYIDSEITENGTAGNVGNELAFVPNTVASVWVNYTLEGAGTRGDMIFGLGARYSGAYWQTDANTIATDDALIWDASYSYDIRNDLALNVNVANLLDEKFVAYGAFGATFYNPGRTVSATLRHRW